MADIIAGRKVIGKFFYQYGFGEKLSSVPQKRLTEIICGLATKGNQSMTTDFAELNQGSQYTAYSFRKLLRSFNVTQSFSAPGCPYDNAVAEAFFRTIKAEEVSRHQYKTEEELRESVAEYIDFFTTADLIKSLAIELQVK